MSEIKDPIWTTLLFSFIYCLQFLWLFLHCQSFKPTVLTVFCTVRSNNVCILKFVRKGGMGQESCKSQAFTICPGSCPRLGHLPWDPYVCESPSQHWKAWIQHCMGLLGGSASGQTHTVGRPGHQCWNGDRLWNLKQEEFKTIKTSTAYWAKGFKVQRQQSLNGKKQDYFSVMNNLGLWIASLENKCLTL